MKKPEIDWTFLDKVNTTAFKGWSAVWLWIGTAAVWAVCAVLATLLDKQVPEAWLATWLTGLAAYSGLGTLQYRSMRETDYGALKIKADATAAAAAKAKEDGGTA